MALTPEQIDRLIQQADGLTPKEGSIFRALVKLTEAEVHKHDDALIRQLVEAMDGVKALNMGGELALWTAEFDRLLSAITAGRARLKGKP